MADKEEEKGEEFLPGFPTVDHFTQECENIQICRKQYTYAIIFYESGSVACIFNAEIVKFLPTFLSGIETKLQIELRFLKMSIIFPDTGIC
jgi:hypothetical protein